MSAHGLGAPATGAPGATPPGPATPPQAPPPATGGQDPQPQAGATPPGQDPNQEPLGPAGIEALRREREARETAERELATYRQKEEEARTASLSEVERLREENKRLQEEREANIRDARQDRIRTRVEALATTMGWHRPQDAAAFLDLAKVQWDDKANEPKGLDEMLQEVVKDRAYLVKGPIPPPAADAGRGTGRGPAGKVDMNTMLRDSVRAKRGG